jgi:hypothetical protein
MPNIRNPKNSILILIPPIEVQETRSLKYTLSQAAHPITYIYTWTYQLVRALHRNRRAVGSIPTRGSCALFFAVVPDQVLLTWIRNPKNSILILIPPSEVQETR